ncbi:Rab3 GTPase-activating protein regulatory subunit N-terminus [Novymonas esmeraldas]|uniref:Rab3 GTPase-activating protein regulatory subunit N-terminus n=1 Tax=Novymonas esmeraldas TaxID=1808958 RepID=A0AAW0EKA1_9TRYP
MAGAAATTPLELTPVGRVPAREAGHLSRGTVPAVVEVLPGLLLLATVVRAKNRCILELVHPTSAPSDRSTGPSSSTAAEPAQRRLSEGADHGAAAPVPAVSVPAALKAGFRVPRVIQLVAEDEGVIETVALVREPLHCAAAAAAAAETPVKDAALVRDAGDDDAASIDHVHVHFFIGTSNGTVLVGNALRGTILAVAQFQYHHRFDDERRGDRLTTTSMTRAEESHGGAEAAPASGTKRVAANQGVVKFVVRQRSDALRWNPSCPASHTSAGRVNLQHGDGAGPHAGDGLTSPAAGSRVGGVYVVHSGGKVVELTRAALDVFVRASADRLDGRRPHLILEWTPDTSSCAFPVAGPASAFAAHVSGVFVLAPPPPSSSVSAMESRTASAVTASAETTALSIRDADTFREAVDGAAESPLLAPLGPRHATSEMLVVGGTSPLFSFFRLQPPHSGFSASSTVRAVRNMVTGVARSLWFGAIGAPGPAERPAHLKKLTAPRTHTFLQADAKCTALQVDPTQQWVAFAIEGGGRLYVADVQSGVTVAVLKGCRAAQFAWWWTEPGGGTAALLLVVYLPLRHAVEVYTARTWQRLAARHVPEGSVLLRCSGVPCEVPEAAAMSRAGRGHGLGRTAVGCDGNGSAPLLMDPAGNVVRATLRWVLTGPLAGRTRLRSPQPPQSPAPWGASGVAAGEGAVSLSASILRGCQSPDDFLELAVQLPLPHVGVSAGGEAVVDGGGEVRAYLQQLTGLRHAVQRRFAPGLAEIATTAMPCAGHEVLSGAAAAVPHGVTAAQCLHYVGLLASLVENYHRLLACTRPTATRYFDPQQWTSALVTADLWKATFSIATHPTVAAFARMVDAEVSATLSTHPSELAIYKKHVAPYTQQVMRDPTRADRAPRLAAPSDFMTLRDFVRCFYAGSARPTFLCGAIESAEDADGSVSILGRLSDLALGMWGLDSFLTQLPALRDLGCSDADVACITLTWVARQAGRDLAALFSSTTVGCLAATLLTFSDEHVAAAVARAPIPFISADGNLATRAAVDSITGLVWCCAVRAALRRPAPCHAHGELLVRRVRQLLQLWYSLTKGAPPPANSPAAKTAAAGADDAVALFLRLGAVEPSCSPAVAQRHRASDWGGSGDGVEALRGDGDVVEVYLQRNGIAVTLLDGFTVPRGDADADAARLFPQFSAFVTLLGEAGYVSDPDTVVVETLPWIDGHEWAADRFHNEALRPMERLWEKLGSAPAMGGGARSGERGHRSSSGSSGSSGGSAAAVYQSCLILVAMSVLQHVLRPLTDVAFFFWETDAVPDGDFFPVDGAPAGLALSGSRTTREYLRSVQRLASFVETMLLRVVVPLQDVERVLLIQHVSLALAADDALLFPLVPAFLRVRLTLWMQVLAQTPRAPLRRARRVRRLLETILLFSDASSMTMGGVPLTQLQSRLRVPWKDLLGGPSRWMQLQLLPTAFLTDFASPEPRPVVRRASLTATVAPPSRHTVSAVSVYTAEEEDPHSTPLCIAAAAALLRRFLVAGAALYASQQDPPAVATGPAAAGAAVPVPALGLIAEDTRQSLMRAAQSLGLQEVYPDIADVVLMDYEIKHLFPVSAVEQEMLLLSTRSAAAQVAAATLPSLLLLLLQHVTAQRKGYGYRGERAAFDTASEVLRSMTQAVSDEARAWLQAREDEMATADGVARAAVTDARTSHADSLLTSPGWVTAVEHQEMGQLMSAVLSTARGSLPHKNLFHLLFTLAQWVCEGRLMLPAATQRVARELPLIVEKWEHLL